jgi:tRNA-dihydrouridine synthase 3
MRLRVGFSSLLVLALSVAVVMVPISALNEFQRQIAGQLILAPLTRGGNLPFRRLCAEFGATHTMSEMAIARNMFKGYHKHQKKERALCRKAPEDTSKFGFQIATKSADEAIRASEYAKENGADWIDLNCGCPIWEATSKGLGVSMIKRPDRLFKLVDLFCKESALPVTVKIRIGVSDSKVNVDEVVQGLKQAGAQAITIHGRSGEARYSKPADWPLLSSMARKHSHEVPIIGNGDLLTHFECNKRMGGEDGVDALMAGRGALIKPWIFKEFRDGVAWNPSPEERIEVYYNLVSNFKDQFGEDDFGQRHSFYFIPWHFNFLCRYRHISQADHDYLYDPIAGVGPPIQNSRALDDYLRSVDSAFDDDPLENLLRSDSPAVHSELSQLLWQSASAGDAVAAFRALAGSPTRVSMLVAEHKDKDSTTTAAETSWSPDGMGPRGKERGGATQQQQQQLHANDHTVFNDVDKCLFHLEMRSGRVVEVRAHGAADNLQVNVVDIGGSGVDTNPNTNSNTTSHSSHRYIDIITGRKGEDHHQFLLGQDVVVLCNVRETVLKGERSEAMILFANDNGTMFSPLLTAPGTPPGTLVTFREERMDGEGEGVDSSENGSAGGASGAMDVLLAKESRKATFKVAPERLRKSMKRVLKQCYSVHKGGRVVYRTSGERKHWQLVTSPSSPVTCQIEGICV